MKLVILKNALMTVWTEGFAITVHAPAKMSIQENIVNIKLVLFPVMATGFARTELAFAMRATRGRTVLSAT